MTEHTGKKLAEKMLTIDRIDSKIYGVEKQMAVLAEALEKYKADREVRVALCERIREVHEESEGVAAELKAARERRNEIILGSNWMPGSSEPNPLAAGTEFARLETEIRRLEGIVSRADNLVNQIFYGKA